MKKLLLFDGSNLLFQMFYGMPARITGKNGRPVQGTLGFVGAALKILRSQRPDYAAVVFDGECENARKALDPAYKANRPDYRDVPEEELPFSQLPHIFAALEYLKIPYAQTACCEADDWLAGYARKYGEEMEIVIVSQDSDFFQLISENVSILRYRGDNSRLWDKAALAEKYGIAPEQYTDFKALVGDTADNIRGAQWIGPKTAGELLREFGSLEALLGSIDRVKKPSVRTSLEESADRLRRNYELIYLPGAAQLPFDLQELAYCPKDVITTQVLRTIDVL